MSRSAPPHHVPPLDREPPERYRAAPAPPRKRRKRSASLEAWLAEPVVDGGSADDDEVVPGRGRRTLRRLAIGLLLAALATGAVVVATRWREADPPRRATVAPLAPAHVAAPAPSAIAPEPARAAVAPAPPERVHLAVSSRPAGAEVFRAADGIKLGVTPFSADVLKTPGQAVLILKLAGHADVRVELPADRDTQRLVQLTPSKRAAPAAPRKRRGHRGKPKIKDGVLDLMED